MRATDKQKIICDLIKEQASFWSSSNDINSPTHFCDIEESVGLFDEFDVNQQEELIDKLTDLYLFIKNINDVGEKETQK